jgi:triphosphoribosyl-dephospho-CoA synthase
MEASAEKPGNVTPTRSFRDMTFEDMARSAVAIGPELAAAGEVGVGAAALAAVTATRRHVHVNTNLGIVLLLAPLARAALDSEPTAHTQGIRARLRDVLRGLDAADARAVYRAIRLAEPGGLGRPVEHDVRDEPDVPLLEAMASAAARDRVASEYVTDFAVTFERGVPALARGREAGLGVRDAIVQAFLELLAALPDTLIARKRGWDAAREVSRGAARVLAAGGVAGAAGHAALEAFDRSLRGPDHGLNPGTTADIVTASSFVAFLDGIL